MSLFSVDSWTGNDSDGSSGRIGGGGASRSATRTRNPCMRVSAQSDENKLAYCPPTNSCLSIQYHNIRAFSTHSAVRRRIENLTLRHHLIEKPVLTVFLQTPLELRRRADVQIAGKLTLKCQFDAKCLID